MPCQFFEAETTKCQQQKDNRVIRGIRAKKYVCNLTTPTIIALAAKNACQGFGLF